SMYEKLKDTVGVANCYMNIGNVHTYSKAYQLAADYYLKALQIYTKRKEERRIASVYSNLANTYYTMGDLKKSKEYSQDALNLYNKYDNDQGRISTLINLGNIESDNHRLKEALNYYNQGYLISKRIKRNYEIGVIQYNKAGLHLDLKKYKESISEVKEAIEISKKISLRDLEMKCYSLLSEAYEKKGDYKSSLEYHKKYTELNDSIFAKSKTNEYLQLEESFQSEKKQKQIERQKAALRQRDAEVKNQTITIIALILVSSLIVVLSLLVTRFYVFKKKENKKLSELNATKDKFFSIIAHDLKNPFSAIMGSSQLLLENIDTMTKEEYIQFLEIIQKSSEAAHKLLDDLLLWARTQTGRLSMEFEDIKAAEIVLECVNLLNNQALAKEIVINVEVKDGLSLFVDNFSINTVVRNLVSNAIKFTKPGGSVSLKAEQSDKMGRIDVIDNGVGIKPEDEAKLFRIDASINHKGTTGENGTGLGLILCKELVEKNNGYITLKSKLGKGSTFSVFLPLSKV
ncbi:MAG: tetratricopeptide repeat-containing sensor histidine kinase, partial [Bacteroidota bacterium]|nr:tetratricopeptide repeat-containing sensor histidine kinase [Bacteroidota bacterium]